MIDTIFCSKKHCRSEATIIVVSKPMCDKHWKEYCNNGNGGEQHE